MIAHPDWGVLPPRHGLFRLADHHEQRKIGATHGSIRSRIPLRTPSGAQTVESELEGMLVEQLAFSTYVHDLITQPVIRYTKGGEDRRYSVDVLAYLTDTGCGAPTRYLVEVKREADLGKNATEYQDRFEVARRYADAIGGVFRILIEGQIKTPYRRNVRLLQRHLGCDPSETGSAAIARALTDGPTDVAGVLASMKAAGFSEADARDDVERAVVDRIVDCDLTAPFTDSTRLDAHPTPRTFALDDDPILRSLRLAPDRWPPRGP